MADIKPMLATASTGASNRRPVSIGELAGTHVYDLKVDGVRAILYRDADGVRLVNRNGVDITYRYPEIVREIEGTGLAIDGEIIADDGRFETTLLRDQQEKRATIARLSSVHPCRFIAFDGPEVHGDWERRRQWLEMELDAHFDTDRVTITPYSDDPAFFTQVAEMGMEGVIAKRKTARYQPGKRSTDWVKFKTVRRVTCIVIGYQPGTGSRQHFGNMQLAMLDADHNPVEVGTVGSGFTEKQTRDLKARLDSGELLVVEIECLNITSGRRLRHPVYKGIRSDLSPIDVTTAQLDELPTC
jgi:bifunctional non-homologous end joining protein LigD